MRRASRMNENIISVSNLLKVTVTVTVKTTKFKVQHFLDLSTDYIYILLMYLRAVTLTCATQKNRFL